MARGEWRVSAVRESSYCAFARREKVGVIVNSSLSIICEAQGIALKKARSGSSIMGSWVCGMESRPWFIVVFG